MQPRGSSAPVTGIDALPGDPTELDVAVAGISNLAGEVAALVVMKQKDVALELLLRNLLQWLCRGGRAWGVCGGTAQLEGWHGLAWIRVW